MTTHVNMTTSEIVQLQNNAIDNTYQSSHYSTKF